jgi:hypothetical protein
LHRKPRRSRKAARKQRSAAFRRQRSVKSAAAMVD